jgi:hypothetical protein
MEVDQDLFGARELWAAVLRAVDELIRKAEIESRTIGVLPSRNIPWVRQQPRQYVDRTV